MALNFERGRSDSPRGHAFIYFTDAASPGAIAATYAVVLPLSVDFSKYMPPFLVGQVPDMGEDGITAFAFPPAPEPVSDLASVQNMADRRDDDLINAGTASLTDVMHLMTVVGEIVEEYAGLCAQTGPPTLEERPTDELESGDTGVDDVVYGLMSEADQLGELTKLVGRLRFATEGGDIPTGEDASARIRSLGRNLPSNRHIDQLLGAAQSSSPDGAKLAQLYLERAYSLLREDYLRVKSIDDEIEATGIVE
ncbi:MAG: hypothetical protein HQ478_00145 [Chloroflexi bacterium]|nr:hypothetical protein [Chloroflexota bacterium]